ncbi:hypothetical protein M885DRAFT_14445 [Pelagophyceae sp. CCMP2097]|nr:hypothetical protein M885DRAFT_14445 [Pelagophyceae sp. CCMP2097]
MPKSPSDHSPEGHELRHRGDRKDSCAPLVLCAGSCAPGLAEWRSTSAPGSNQGPRLEVQLDSDLNPRLAVSADFSTSRPHVRPQRQGGSCPDSGPVARLPLGARPVASCPPHDMPEDFGAPWRKRSETQKGTHWGPLGVRLTQRHRSPEWAPTCAAPIRLQTRLPGGDACITLVRLWVLQRAPHTCVLSADARGGDVANAPCDFGTDSTARGPAMMAST